jgi:hypothetical protein
MTIHFKIDNTINTLIVKKQLNCSLSSVHSASQDRPACLRAPTHASCLVPHAALASPRAAYALCLALHSTAPHASRPNSRCAQRRSDLRAVASSSVLAPSSASMSVQLGVASRWAYVVTVCFMRFRCMLHMFLSGCCKIRSSVAYVAMTMHLCCKMYVSTVSAVSNVCCKCFIMTLYTLHWLYTYIASVCFKWFKRMLQMFYECCICCSAHTL